MSGPVAGWMQIDVGAQGLQRIAVIEEGNMPVETFLNLYNDVLVTEIKT